MFREKNTAPGAKKQQDKKKSKFLNNEVWLVISAVLALFVIFIFSYFRQKDITETTKMVRFQSSDIVEPEFKPEEISQFDLKIEKIGIFAPVVPNVEGTDQDIYNESLEKGVAHYKGTALPNSGSNIFIFGHSSTILGVGPYAKIFARLGELSPADIIEINFNQSIYRYSVFEKEIVLSTNTSVLNPTEKEQLTLMTCWPVGTDEKRLVILAKRE